MKSRWVAALCSVLAVVGLAFVACGGGDDNKDTSGGGNAATTTTKATNANGATTAKTAEPTAGGGDGGSDTVDACSLVTKEEAAAALGTTVKDGERQDTAPIFSCTYAASEGINEVSVTVLVFRDNDQAKEGVQQTIENNGYEEIAGIGERAYTDPLYDLSALQGKYEVSVNLISDLGKDAELTAAKDLVRKALDRLP